MAPRGESHHGAEHILLDPESDGSSDAPADDLLPQAGQLLLTRWRWALVSAAALGLVGFAAGLLSSGHSSPLIGTLGARQIKADRPTGLANSHRADLLIEGDLAKLVSESVPWAARPGNGHTVEDAAGQLFDHTMSSTGLGDEFNAVEREAFRLRFVVAMGETKDASKYWVQDYLTIAGEKLESTKPVMTKALAKSFNEAKLSFKLKMRDWMVHESQEMFKSRLGRTPLATDARVSERTFQRNLGSSENRGVLPASFDSRKGWPECEEVIGKIHNQGHCGSCWVFGALGSLDTRLCIKTNASFSGDLSMLSRGFGASCTSSSDGCMGGWEYYVFEYIEEHPGIPSTSCAPYFAGEDYADHWVSSMPAPPCPEQCDARYTRSMADDFFKPLGIGAYKLVVGPDEQGLHDMKAAIYEGGTIPFGIYANGAFMGYESGIFDSCPGRSANHAVQALGWGEGYILGQNSWGSDWGDGGRFKVALCVPTDFTIPGEISEEDYPLPIPSATFTTSTTLPPPVNSTLPCMTHEDGCVTSPNWPGQYPNSHTCDISYKIGKLNVTLFDVERGYDILTVNGEEFTGTHTPDGVVPHTNIHWAADSSVQGAGWKICPTLED